MNRGLSGNLYSTMLLAVLVAGSSGALFAQSDRATDATRETRPAAGRNDVGFNPGWLGLIGLAGLAGLMRSDSHARDTQHTGAAAMSR